MVSGAAVGFHGYYLQSRGVDGQPVEKDDLDFWYNPVYSNYYNLLKALRDPGQDISAFMKKKTPDPKRSFFRYEFDQFTLDFLPSVPGHAKFIDCCDRRKISIVQDIEIPIISLEDIIISKAAISRKKDLDDIEGLKPGSHIE